MKRREKRIYGRLLRDLWQTENHEKGLDLAELFDVQKRVAEAIMRLEQRTKKYTKPYSQSQQSRINQIQRDISLFRLIGDALASVLIKLYTIRQHCKHPPATRYLIDQRGFQHELEATRQFLVSGHLAILHQITNCLRMGDISIVTGNTPVTVEVKYDLNEKDPRLARQVKRAYYFDKLHGEAAELTPEELKEAFPDVYSEEMSLVRAQVDKRYPSQQTDFTVELNEMLKKTLVDKKDRFVTFDGITAYIIRPCERDRVRSAMHEGIQPLTEEQSGFLKDAQEFTMVDIWNNHLQFPYLPPITSLFEPKVATKLVFGDLLLLTLMNGAKMAEYLRSKNIEIETEGDQHFWRTHKCKVNGKEQYLFLPLQHVMFAAHSTEYLANYCLEISHALDEAETMIRKRYELQIHGSSNLIRQLLNWLKRRIWPSI
ncbi:hypothetical protein H7X87_00750 [Acetobacteraceae bacterium]|nr:hypothetical protein [Candidatus Parcubacteria bacterium]